MAKSKVRKDTAALTRKPEGIQTNDGTLLPETPDLNFSNLSEKIRAQFQSVQEDRKKRPKKDRKEEKRQRAEDGLKTSKAKKPDGAPGSLSSRGIKRNHNGEALPKSTDGGEDPPEMQEKSENDQLKEEVLALGGTSEDLDLIDGAESASEVEDDGAAQGTGADSMQKDKGIQKGMTNILKEIALAQGGAAAPEASESDGGGQPGEELQIPEKEAPVKVADVAVASRSKKGNLSFSPRPDWFNAEAADVDRTKAPAYTLPRYSLDQLHEHARSLLDAENEEYKKTQQSTASQSFYTTVITSGTLSDKISALTLAVQESPIHNVKALEALVALAKKRSRAQAVDVLRALKDLFAQGSLLPSDRKLYNFNHNTELLSCFTNTKSWKPGEALPRTVKPPQLISWAYESWLKETYFEVLKTLEVWCNDEIEFSKSRAVSYVYELLKEKPEQEANLLRMLVNKLGDPVKKIASQTSYLMMQLMTAHPAMKETIISAVEAELLFRPGQSLHAKYYAIVTLNQTGLSKTEEAVAAKLLDIYFGLFVGLLKPPEEEKKVHAEEVASTTVASGANAEELNNTQESVGRQRKRSSAKKKAETGQGQEGDLQDKLTSAILTGINRAYPYTDASQESLSTHLDALFKITHSSNFNTSIQAMLLIQQLSSLHQASNDRFYRTLYESLLDARLITSSKQSLYLNLLYRSLKSDVNQKRVKAFAKRITQILTLHQPPFVCGAFFLLKELESTFPSMTGLYDQAEEHEDDEEAFMDVVEDGMAPARLAQLRKASSQNQNEKLYDGRKRDPEYSNAEYSCLWEIYPFLAHFHPSVALSADHLLSHSKLPGKPDLNLHTLIHFLDRFVYRNPKPAASDLRGSSIMQPLAASDSSGLLVSGALSGQQRAPVNTNSFRTQKEGDVAAEDVFFHKYFSSLGKEKPRVKTKARAGADGDSAVDGEESEIWKAMIDSAPDLEGINDSDDDLEMADLESDFEEDMDAMSADLGEDDEDDEDDEDQDGEAGSIGDDSSSGLDDDIQKLEDESDEGGVAVSDAARKESSTKTNSTREHRKRMKKLPTFASASDYAKMLADDDGEDLG